jgi:hypothetical protein
MDAPAHLLQLVEQLLDVTKGSKSLLCNHQGVRRSGTTGIAVLPPGFEEKPVREPARLVSRIASKIAMLIPSGK